MNKKIAIILALAMSASMACAGCNGSKPEETTGTSAVVTEASTTETSKEESKTEETKETSDTSVTAESSEDDGDKADDDSTEAKISAEEDEGNAEPADLQAPVVLDDDSGSADSDDSLSEPVVVVDAPDEDNGSEKDGKKSSEDNDYYSGVTAMGKADVEAFCAKIRDAYIKSDWKTISEYLRYPAIVGNEELEDADAFMKYIDGKTPAAEDLKEMENETCKDIYYSGKGICLGTGQVWIIDENYLTDKTPNLQIFSMFGV